jgi:hypothetical protein
VIRALWPTELIARFVELQLLYESCEVKSIE